MSGVIVLLMDSSGAEVARTLSSTTGAFRVRARDGGVFRLRALRIGFRPVTSAPLALRGGETIDHTIVLDGIAIMLGEVRATADRRCTVRPDSSSAAFEAWQEARTALTAAALTRVAAPYEMEIVRFERRLRARDGALEHEQEHEQHGLALRPFVSVAASVIAARGYSVTDSGGTTFNAPDEEVLLSEDFAATHCLRLEEPDAEGNTVLGFAPTADRPVSEIAGTLTFAPRTNELRTIAFHYVNLPREIDRARPGGEVHFRRLPTGGWIVDRWQIRMPLIVSRLERAIAPGSTLSMLKYEMREVRSLDAILETGGEVVQVARGDSVVFSAPRAEITGTLTERSGTPVAGAILSIVGTRASVTTDNRGAFRIGNLRPGEKVVSVYTPLLDSLGLPAIGRSATAAHDGGPWSVVLPPRDSLLASACGGVALETPSMGLVRGVTRGPGGERVGGVPVTATWYAPPGTMAASALGENRTVGMVSSTTGDYLVCGVHTDQRVTLRATNALGAAGEVITRIPPDSRILLRDVTIGKK
ncbi:MAG: hypothetical protein JWN53_2100 [Gemmatimonadetes bacterium]|nr:hypothetical protein [Gemmatimonadota bacterium]